MGNANTLGFLTQNVTVDENSDTLFMLIVKPPARRMPQSEFLVCLVRGQDVVPSSRGMPFSRVLISLTQHTHLVGIRFLACVLCLPNWVLTF